MYLKLPKIVFILFDALGFVTTKLFTFDQFPEITGPIFVVTDFVADYV